jgi:hypothetical protein
MMAHLAAEGRTLRYLFAVTAAVALAGCASSTGSASSTGKPVTSSSGTTWREPARYSFVLDSRCGEQPLIGRFRVSVGQGAVTEAVGLDEAARGALAGRGHEFVPTLGRLVEELDSARRSGADLAQADVDPADGHPVRITIDPKKLSVDDELCYTISEYAPGSP